MTSRLADVSQEAVQLSPRRSSGQKMNAAFKNLSYKYGNPIGRIVGTSGERLTLLEPQSHFWDKLTLFPSHVCFS